MSAVPGPRTWSGGVVSDRIRAVLAPNPSPMTLQGTNTYVLRAPGAGRSMVIDPGPLHEGHLQAVLEAATADGARVGVVLLTHTHPDHADGLDRFLHLCGAPVRGIAHGGLADEDVVSEPGLTVRAIATPGHTSDSACFLLLQERTLISGDTILGSGTTVVAYPDGHLGAYLNSLHRIARLVHDGEVTRILPAHSAPHEDADAIVAAYLAHRSERLDQIRAALAAGIGADGADSGRPLADAIVATVYADAPRNVWPAARLSVLAQLEYLQQELPSLGGGHRA